MQIDRIDPDPHTGGAWVQAVRVSAPGGLVFVGGQNGVADDGTLVAGGIGEQTAQAMRNLARALGKAGAAPHDLVQLTIAVAAGESLEAGFAGAMQSGVPLPAIAISVVIVSGLARPGALVEISAIAAVA